MLAITATAVGFAYDAGTGDKELSAAFSVCYVAGCVLAVLAVRSSGLFTAVIQPPLILFGAVPAAYLAFHGSTINGLKDILINCGYPLIERFPLMFFTSAIVLVIGAVRWYLDRQGRRLVASDDTDDEPAPRAKAKSSTEETTLLDAVDAAPRRRREQPAERRPRRTAATDDAPRRARRPATGTSRSRHTRPPEPEPDLTDAGRAEPTPRPRRRPATSTQPPVDPTGEPRKRPRPPSSREPRRNLPPVDARGYDQPARRPRRDDRDDRPNRYDPADRYEPLERPERRRRPSYEDPYEGRPTTNGTNGTHHPVSRVRYRGSDDEDQRTEHRSRPRRARGIDADSWEYDV